VDIFYFYKHAVFSSVLLPYFKDWYRYWTWYWEWLNNYNSGIHVKQPVIIMAIMGNSCKDKIYTLKEKNLSCLKLIAWIALYTLHTWYVKQFQPFLEFFIYALTYTQLDWRWLESFHMRCQRRILHIRWHDYISNNEVLRRTGLLAASRTVSSKDLPLLDNLLHNSSF